MITVFFPAGWSHTDCHHWFRERGLPHFYLSDASGNRCAGYAFTFQP